MNECSMKLPGMVHKLLPGWYTNSLPAGGESSDQPHLPKGKEKKNGKKRTIILALEKTLEFQRLFRFLATLEFFISLVLMIHGTDEIVLKRA